MARMAYPIRQRAREEPGYRFQAMTALAREIFTASVKAPTPTTGLDRSFCFIFFLLTLYPATFWSFYLFECNPRPHPYNQNI